MKSKGFALSDEEIGRLYGTIAELITMPDYFYESVAQRVTRDIRSTHSKSLKLRFMDFGAGNGFLLEKVLKKLSKEEIGEVIVVDNSLTLLERAKVRLSQFDVKQTYLHRSGNVDFPEIHGANLDFVLSTEVLEHLKTPQKYLADIFGALRPGGRLYLSVPNGSAFEPFQTIVEFSGVDARRPIFSQFIHGENPIKSVQPISVMYYYRELLELIDSGGFRVLVRGGFEHLPYLYDTLRYLAKRFGFSSSLESKMYRMQLSLDRIFKIAPWIYYRSFFILERPTPQ